MLPNSQKKADYKKRRCGNLLLYPIDEASRIALAVRQNNNPHQRICREPPRAVHTNDVVPSSPSSQLRNFARISSKKIISITPFSSTVEVECKCRKSFLYNERCWEKYFYKKSDLGQDRFALMKMFIALPTFSLYWRDVQEKKRLVWWFAYYNPSAC